MWEALRFFIAHWANANMVKTPLNAIPISKAQAKALKAVKEQAQILAQQQWQQRLQVSTTK